MTGRRLPEGFITITAPGSQTSSATDLRREEDEYVEIDKLAIAWKVYTAAFRVTEEVHLQRLQNLYWRLWSNPYLTLDIPTSYVNELSSRFAQGLGRFDRPLPLARPRIRRYKGRQEATSASSPGQAQIRRSTEPGLSLDTTPAGEFPAPSPAPQSILKKARSNSDPRRKSVTVEIPGSAEDLSALDEDLRSSLEEPPSSTLNIPSTAGGISKVTSFVASTAKKKTRPGLGRRKSSQGPGAKAIKSPTKASGEDVPTPRNRSTGQTATTALVSALKLPQPAFQLGSSWQSVDDSDTTPSNPTKPREPPTSSSVLVEGNFRSRFAENQRRVGSNMNLADVGRLGKSGSMVRFDLPERSKEMDAALSRRSDVSGRTVEALDRRSSGDSQVLEDDDDQDVELPRTKSQLSMQIQSRRKESGMRDLGPTPTSPQPKNKVSRRGAKEGEEEEEEDLLTMGRRDGFTKAGGVTPGRNTRRISGLSEHRYRSPSPPPIY